MMEILNLKLVILVEYQHIKIFLQYAKFQIGCEEVFLIKTVKKKLFRGHILTVFLKAKKLQESFTKRNCKNKSRRV